MLSPMTEGTKGNKAGLEHRSSKKGPQHNWSLNSREVANPPDDWSTKDGWYLDLWGGAVYMVLPAISWEWDNLCLWSNAKSNYKQNGGFLSALRANKSPSNASH